MNRHNQMSSIEFPLLRCNNLLAGITAVIGIIGGIYFITKTANDFLCKISSRKHKQPNENVIYCNVCCTEIDRNDEKTYVKCFMCKKYICRSIKCSNWLPKFSEWECKLCQTSKESLAQTSSWVADQITFNQEKLIHTPRARSEVYIPIRDYNDSFMHFESVSQAGANSTITADQKCKIREFVEEIVAKLLGGNLDTVAVSQLSQSENYLPDPKFNKKSMQDGTSQESMAIRPTENNFSDITETRLRQMIQKIIAETMSLPPLTNGHAVSEIALDRPSRTNNNQRPSTNNGYYHKHRTEHYFEPTIYQDLLATAVLNKIVDKQLNNNPWSVPERKDDDDNLGQQQHTDIDRNFNVEKLSTSSGSSVEPQSDCSYPEIEQIINNNDDKSSELFRNSDRDSVMSDYLANHMVPLPDLNQMATESDEDDYISVTSSTVGEGTWEKNWLFKKKKSTLSGSVTASSIGMLVPDPKEDVRAQIGDKTTDEVSDLSELGSDSDNSLNSLRTQLEPINDRLVNKHIIGGQNNKMILDEIIERSSMISSTTANDAEPIVTDTFNENIIDAITKTEAINDNINRQYSSSGKNIEDSTLGVLEDLSSNPLAGSIAEREYKKWYNAVEMPNNPYAPEALKRRISSGSQERFVTLPNISPTKDLNPLDLLNESKMNDDENILIESDYKRYSRDYYINKSLTPSPVSSATKDERETTKKLTACNEEDPKFDIYKAMPAQVVEINHSLMETTSPKGLEIETNSVSTSDDSDTIKCQDFGRQQLCRSNPKAKSASLVQRQREIENETDIKERPSSLVFNRSKSSGNVITPTRGSTPVAFKFLQPKRRLLEPNQVLTLDEQELETTSIPLEKPVIEAEVVKALPSVKALAKAFLMTTNTTQPEKRWLQKARTLSQSTSRKTPLDRNKQSESQKPEDDITITSDLSSLETDSSSIDTEKAISMDLTADSCNAAAGGGTSPVTVRQGVLKNNIAFFENLKNK